MTLMKRFCVFIHICMSLFVRVCVHMALKNNAPVSNTRFMSNLLNNWSIP